jgi:SAM-dependent methyltransferase
MRHAPNPGFKLTGENFIPGMSEGRHEEDHLARYRFASAFVREKRVLDIACGPGYGSHMLAEAGAREVVGVDISPQILGYARDNYSREGVFFREGSVYDYEADPPYDIITSFETIEHVPEYRRAIANLFKLLKPGGVLLVSSPDRRITSPAAKRLSDKPVNPFHTQEFTVAELVECLEGEGFLVPEDAVYGQRQQRLFRNPFLKSLYRMVAKPHVRANPELTPVGDRVPRYFTVAAVKPVVP